MAGCAMRIRDLACALLAAACLAGCGGGTSSSTGDGSSIESAARSYTEAVLRGTAQDANASISTTCPHRATDAALVAVRNLFGTRTGIALDTLHIISVETRNVTADSGEAWVHVNLPHDIEGNDNWLTYSIEDGRWKLTDCGHLPFGYNGSSGPGGGQVTGAR
jgi:hypothetical protein